MPKVVKHQDLSAQQPESPNLTAYSSSQERLYIAGGATVDGVTGSFEATGRSARWLGQPLIACIPAGGVVLAGDFLELNNYVTMALAMVTFVLVLLVLLRQGKAGHGAQADDGGPRPTIVLEMTNEVTAVETAEESPTRREPTIPELPRGTEGSSGNEATDK